ncbi:MAG: hypothetical protein ACREB6_04155 [Rhodospirillales bacterium]
MTSFTASVAFKRRVPTFLIAACLGATVLIALVLSMPAPSTAAQTATATPEKTELPEDFVRWRKSIPDYERRLYERVKALNSRTVELMRVEVAGIIVIIACLVIIIFMLRQRMGRGRPLAMASTALEVPAGKTGKPYSRSQMKSILRKLDAAMARQKHLHDMLSKLRGDLEKSDNTRDRLLETVDLIRQEMASLDPLIEDIRRIRDKDES